MSNALEKIKKISLINEKDYIIGLNCRLLIFEPFSKTMPHNHSEGEVWILISGEMTVKINDQIIDLKMGNFLKIDPLVKHQIINGEHSSVLHVLWWNNAKKLKNVVEHFVDSSPKESKYQLIIPAIVTPNGPMHLGHAGGPYIIADVLRRAFKMQGIRTSTFLGTLGHQEHIQIAAHKDGSDYYALAKKNTDSILQSFALLDIEYDFFLHPSPPARFKEIMSEIFYELYHQKIIYEKEASVPFDNDNNCFVVDAHLKGQCPMCRAFVSGVECENCGLYLDDSLLLKPSTLKNGTVETRPLKRLYLKLEPISQKLAEHYQTMWLTTSMRTYLDHWFSRDLPDVCISNPLTEGINIPLPGYKKQYFTVAFEHVARYFLAFEMFSQKKGRPQSWKDFVLSDEHELTITFGNDNFFARTILAPSILIALKCEAVIPRYFHSNHFMNLNKSKFSTSKNNAIWVNEFVNEHNREFLRFYLIYMRPEFSETNFSVDEFKKFNQALWKEGFANYLFKIQSILDKHESKILPGAGEFSHHEVSFLRITQELGKNINRSIAPRNFNSTFLCSQIERYVLEAIRFADSATSWKHMQLHTPRSSLLATQTRLLLYSLAVLIVGLHPVMPNLTTQLANCLGLGSITTALLAEDWLQKPFNAFSLNSIIEILQ